MQTPETGARTFSFIRTMTVGPGIAPDLLTLPQGEGARGLNEVFVLPPVGISAPP
jgi:hypothetical protein